jgi:hypothetical protein
VRPVGSGSLHPLAQRRLGQVEIAGGGANRFAFVKHQAHGAGFELLGELAARSPLWCVGHRSGHRIPLWKDVHRTGSSPDLSRAALEAVAIDAYRMNRISGYQLSRLLEIPSRYELDGFLKHHGVPLEYTIEDFERESSTSARLWQRRQEELAAEPDRRPE